MELHRCPLTSTSTNYFQKHRVFQGFFEVPRASAVYLFHDFRPNSVRRFRSEMYDTYAYFWVRGFKVPPSVITSELGLDPTEIWVKGDPWLAERNRSFNTWHLHSPLPRTEVFMDKHLEALLSLLEPQAIAIQSICSRYEVGINCVGYYYNENPGFHLSAALIARLHSLSLDIDFDLYCCSEPS